MADDHVKETVWEGQREGVPSAIVCLSVHPGSLEEEAWMEIQPKHLAAGFCNQPGGNRARPAAHFEHPADWGQASFMDQVTAGGRRPGGLLVETSVPLCDRARHNRIQLLALRGSPNLAPVHAGQVAKDTLVISLPREYIAVGFNV